MYKSLLIVIFLFLSCTKVYYYPDDQLYSKKAVISHRGGRNAEFRENTLPGCKAALAVYQGVEIDIQISQNRTIWLSHNEKVMGCDGEIGCFPEVTDKTISSIDSCNGNAINYYRLEDLIAWMAINCPNKYLNVDLKGWIPCSANSADIEGMMRLMAEKVIALGEKYHFIQQMQLETDAISVLLWAKQHSDKINTYLNVYGDIERGMLMALRYSLTGISFKTNLNNDLTADYAHLFHKKGLRLIVWNLKDSIQLKQYLDMDIDFCEYDIP